MRCKKIPSKIPFYEKLKCRKRAHLFLSHLSLLAHVIMIAPPHPPHASPTNVHASTINDQKPHVQLIKLHQFCTPPNHEHTNNDNGVDNGPRDQHFKTMCLRHINKHINLIGWHFHSSYKSCNQSHNTIMKLGPLVNLDININIGEP
jgi:hypothetical protein